MKILSIETSCDETAVAVLECQGDPKEGNFSFEIIGNALHSQIEHHKEFGGVVPMMAKREHAKNLIPLFKKAIALLGASSSPILLTNIQKEHLAKLFGRETEFKNHFIELAETCGKPNIDALAVTQGPGLEPALWMGIIFADALSYIYDIPLVPVNHMEGHILSVLPQKIEFPALALLISGGHTELVLMREWNSYEVIGQTRDDAVGEAFDKVARMLDLPYPGGPEISKLADLERTTKTSTVPYILPRPMIHSKDYDFSFSGIKTAVLYSLKAMTAPLTGNDKQMVAKEFEDAITEVLVAKTLKAIDEFGAMTVIVGGGVVSNTHVRQELEKALSRYSNVRLLLPDKELRTDNALMIGIAGYVNWLGKNTGNDLIALGNLSIDNTK